MKYFETTIYKKKKLETIFGERNFTLFEKRNEFTDNVKELEISHRKRGRRYFTKRCS